MLFLEKQFFDYLLIQSLDYALIKSGCLHLFEDVVPLASLYIINEVIFVLKFAIVDTSLCNKSVHRCDEVIFLEEF